MRRISLSVLAGVALLSATAVLLPSASPSFSEPSGRVSTQLIAVAPSRLTPVAPARLGAVAPARLGASRSGLQPHLAQFLARFLAAYPPFASPGAKAAQRPTAIQAPPLILPLQSQGMACPVATGASPGGCSIVPCAVYVGAGQASYTVTSGPGLSLPILPRLIPKPSPGGRTPAGTCVSRPGRPPQMRWVSSAARWADGRVMKTVDLRTVLETWDTSTGAIVSYIGLGCWAVVYALAAARPSPRGRRWPRARTAWFIAGLALLLFCFASGLEVYEDNPTVHVVQHMLVMMAVPPLLAFGAPLTLLLRTLSTAGRRTVVRVLDDPAMRLWRGRWAGVWLCVDYYLTMYVYQLTPLRSFAEHHAGVHLAVHGYFLLCGILFWLPVAGLDPTRYRPRPRVKQAMVALGLPAFALLGAIELAKGERATGVAYIVTGVALTLIAQLYLRYRQRTAAAAAPANSAAVSNQPRALV